MPKRKKTQEEELKSLYKKLKRLEKKIKDGETVNEEGGTAQMPTGEASRQLPPPTDQTTTEEDPSRADNSEETTTRTENDEGDTPVEPVEVIDPEVLLILGDPAVEIEKYGPKINENLANRWGPILKKGLNKEEKEPLIKLYQVPSNCQLIQSPTLNPEIASAISEAAKNRDKKLEAGQQQLGVGITALGRAMSLAITNCEGEKIQIIKHMNDAARILADLHFNETRGRKQLITPTLDKNFLDLVKEVDHDEFLYGKNLSEKIKTLKNIERSSQSIKKAEQAKATAPTYPSSNKFQTKGNSNNPPRYTQRFTTPYRGTARGGFKRPPLPPRRPAPAPASATTKKDTPRAAR